MLKKTQALWMVLAIFLLELGAFTLVFPSHFVYVWIWSICAAINGAIFMDVWQRG